MIQLKQNSSLYTKISRPDWEHFPFTRLQTHLSSKQEKAHGGLEEGFPKWKRWRTRYLRQHGQTPTLLHLRNVIPGACYENTRRIWHRNSEKLVLRDVRVKSRHDLSPAFSCEERASAPQVCRYHEETNASGQRMTASLTATGLALTSDTLDRSMENFSNLSARFAGRPVLLGLGEVGISRIRGKISERVMHQDSRSLGAHILTVLCLQLTVTWSKRPE